MNKRHHRTVLGPDRLCDAADVLLRAVHSPLGFNAPVEVYVGPPGRAGRGCKDVWTLEECMDAMAMLIRLGLIPARHPTLGVG